MYAKWFTEMELESIEKYSAPVRVDGEEYF